MRNTTRKDKTDTPYLLTEEDGDIIVIRFYKRGSASGHSYRLARNTAEFLIEQLQLHLGNH